MPRGKKNKNRSGTSTLPRNNATKSSSTSPPKQPAPTIATSSETVEDLLPTSKVELQETLQEKLPELQKCIQTEEKENEPTKTNVPTDTLTEAKAKLEQIQEKINTIEETLSASQASQDISNQPTLADNPRTPENSPEKSNGNDHQQTLKRKRNRNKKKKQCGNEPINKEHENSPDSIDVIQLNESATKTVDLLKQKEESPVLTTKPQLNLDTNTKKTKKNKNSKNSEQDDDIKIEKNANETKVEEIEQSASELNQQQSVLSEPNAANVLQLRAATNTESKKVLNVVLESEDKTKNSNKASIQADKLFTAELVKATETCDTTTSKAQDITVTQLELKIESVANVVQVKQPLENSASAIAKNVECTENIAPATDLAETQKKPETQSKTIVDSGSLSKSTAKTEITEKIKPIEKSKLKIETKKKSASEAAPMVSKDPATAILATETAKTAKPETKIEEDNIKEGPVVSKLGINVQPDQIKPISPKSAKKIDNLQSESKPIVEKKSKSHHNEESESIKPADTTKIPPIPSKSKVSADIEETTLNTAVQECGSVVPIEPFVKPEAEKPNIKNEDPPSKGTNVSENKNGSEILQQSSSVDKKKSNEKNKANTKHKTEKKQSTENKAVDTNVIDLDKTPVLQELAKAFAAQHEFALTPATFAKSVKDEKDIPNIEIIGQATPIASSLNSSEKSLQEKIDDNIVRLLELSQNKSKPKSQKTVANSTEPKSKSDDGKEAVQKNVKQTVKPEKDNEPKPSIENLKSGIVEAITKQPLPTVSKISEIKSAQKSNEKDTKNENKLFTAEPTQIVEESPIKALDVKAKTDSPIILQEGETVKIWKILEEASKSSTPVEIEVKSDSTEASNLKDQLLKQQLLASTKTSKDAKTSPKSLPKKKSPSPIEAKEQKQTVKGTSPPKVVETQPKRTNESKKKEKSASPSTTPEEKPPFSDLNPAPDIEIPLDMSMISSTAFENESAILELPDDFKDTKNLTAEDETQNVSDQKNVQGSDFVQFAEASANSAKSLETINIAKGSDDEQRKSVSPSEEKRNKNEINSMQTKTQVVERPQITTAVRLMDILEPKMVQPDPFPREKATNKKKNNGIINEKTPSSIENSHKSGNDINHKADASPHSLQTNSKHANQNNKETRNTNHISQSEKPIIPPKPEHLAKSKNIKGLHGNKPPERGQEKCSPSSPITDDEEDYIEYKFMPRQVFICTICQSCKVPLQSKQHIACESCGIVRYCSIEHLTNNKTAHKDLCNAIQEIAKKRGGHIYNNARILSNDDFRSLRVHTLNICENLLKRSLETYEREILLFPRICAKSTCREWRQNLLSDCEKCGQIFYCTSSPDHLPEIHPQWCKAFDLYQKIVVKQNTSGRIEPSLPSKVMTKPYLLPNYIDEVFKDLYKNYSVIKDECIYATLTQQSTAPLTAFSATQICAKMPEDIFTIHLIGAELQFEADILNVWETFFLHLAPQLVELNVVFCGPELNAENLPLEILSRIRMCRSCRLNCRIVKFDFQCGKLYHEYAKTSSFTKPDLICFYNPGLYRTTGFNGIDTWPETIRVAVSLCCPIVVTSYTEFESPRDLERLQSEAAKLSNQRELIIISPPKLNPFSSQRPERNFVSDEMAPMIFKNFYFFVVK